MIERLSDSERQTLIHSLTLAASTLADDVDNIQQQKPNALLTANGITSLVKVFQEYHDATNAIRERIEHARFIHLDDGEDDA